MKPLKLAYNRVWRTYIGGKAIDRFYQIDEPTDGHYPEVWIASTTTAVNPDIVENEGLSQIEGEGTLLVDLINEDPVGYLGKDHVVAFGTNTGVLVKMLDAAERLTIQVHPNNEKAMELFDSRFGKTEAWYVMEGREIDGEAPHIYLGFKEGIQRFEWVELFKAQDTRGMLACLNKIYVQPGDVFLIEGGTPHAIGSGSFIIEIQEPTDLTIRIEKVTPGGYAIPDRICHQGLGFEKMFECFDYVGYTEEQIKDKWRLASGSEGAEPSTTLIGYDHTKCFSLESMTVTKQMTISNQATYAVLMVLEGEGQLVYEGGVLDIHKGDQLFVPYSLKEMSLKTKETVRELKILRCLPPVAGIRA